MMRLLLGEGWKLQRSGGDNSRHVVCRGRIRQVGWKKGQGRGKGEIGERERRDLAAKGREW